ncbi:MAG: FAD/NAD(P)-binding protein, partial [Pirellulaceae bacterium]|nr:FAD/NAD(P)-binding protein [Pirellulaceae bacterium]
MNVLSASLPQKKRRLAIIGGGSSGLISLKYAIDLLPSWDVQCFEQSDRITGVWGNPYPGFVSTTTKYATQFACHPRFDAGVSADGGASREEFFRDGEYGEYLQDFANGFSLSPRISLRTRVVSLRQSDNGWILTLTQLDSSSRADSGRPVGPTETTEEAFDAVILCTGLAAAAKPLDCGVKTLSVADMTRPNGLETVTNQRIVVIGGGESAVDFADRLARPELQNEVYLSLHSGVR